MIGEVCLYDKFSYCQNGVRCRRVHLKETCLIRECDYRNCRKRHPRPCRFLMLNGFCKFGSSCRYSHRLPKHVEDQNERIKAMEKEINGQNGKIKIVENKNTALEKMIEDQNLTIRKLQLQLSTQYEKEIEDLKKDIEKLNVANNEKEKTLKSLVKSLNELEENIRSKDDNGKIENEGDDDTDSSDEDENEIKVYIQNALDYADSAYRDIEKLRKNSREAKNIFQELSKKLSDVPFVVGMSQLFQEEVSRIQSLSKSTEAKLDKESCILEIERFKKQLQTVDRRYCL